MKLVAIMPTRNSDWVLGLSLRALLMWVDEVVIGLHACTDGTRDIAEQVVAETKRVRIQVQPDTGHWAEMANRQALLEVARKRGATHIVTVDDDEVLTGDLLPEIRSIVEEMTPGRILTLRWLCMPTLGTYFTTGIWGDGNFVSVCFPDLPHLHWKARDGYDFHHRHPMGQQFAPLRRGVSGGLMHLQFTDRRRLCAKQMLYCLTEKLRWPEREPIQNMVRRYSQAINTGGERTAAVNPEWWQPYGALLPDLHLGAEPWQLEACKRILRDNPGIGDGLNDFGLGLL